MNYDCRYYSFNFGFLGFFFFFLQIQKYLEQDLQVLLFTSQIQTKRKTGHYKSNVTSTQK